MLKTCRDCSKDKPLSSFYRRKRMTKGVQKYTPYCRDCHRIRCAASRKKYYQTHTSECIAVSRRIVLLKQYGLTPERLTELVSAQHGLCPILGEAGDLVVDHDHQRPGTFRGVISRKANVAIGMLRDDPEILERAAAYLRAAACQS